MKNIFSGKDGFLSVQKAIIPCLAESGSGSPYVTASRSGLAKFQSRPDTYLPSVKSHSNLNKDFNFTAF